MKTALIAFCMLALPALAPETTPAQGQCYTPAPYCPYPSQPICLCSGYGTNCGWRCVNP